jgi:hypothetical protein
MMDTTEEEMHEPDVHGIMFPCDAALAARLGGCASVPSAGGVARSAADDRHLLFGLLALQNGIINQGQLVAAFQAWTLDNAPCYNAFVQAPK